MQPKHLLILEDDTATNRLLSILFEEFNFTKGVQFETNGQRGLHYLASAAAENTFPDLILVDMKMPVMDGIGFLEQYETQYWPHYPHTKVMVLTSAISGRDEHNVLRFASVSSFITKPLTEEKITELLYGLNTS